VTYDAIVVGGGHNGLVCAAYLGRAGRRTLVLESRDRVGGFCTSEETVPEAPGFLMNATSIDHVVTNIPPSIVDELDLARHGLRWVAPDPFYSYLHPEGLSIGFWRDTSRTIEEIRRLSRKDAAQYERFVSIMRDFWWTAAPYLQGHPTKVAAATMLELAKRARRTRKHLAAAARMLLGSPGAIIDEWFERDELKAFMATYAVATMSSLDEPGSGIVMSVMAVQHEWGVRRPVGGQSAFSEALAAEVRAQGGEVRVSAPVAEVLVAGGRTVGVKLVDGEELRAGTVVAAIDPMTLVRKLLPPDAVPEQLGRELRGLSVLRNNISGFKGDVALSTKPSLPKHGREDALLASCMLIAPSLEYVRRSTTAALRGELTDEIPLWVITPTILDRTLVPAGSDAHSLYLYLPAVPYQLAGGMAWDAVKDKHLQRCLDLFEDCAPGTTASVIGATATSPQDLAHFSHVTKGNLFHVDMTLSQFGPWRPTPSLSGYRTPVAGLWHTGAGAHPLGTLNGWSGRTTARTVLKARSGRG
jgi:beta-carotene ketolase (CrtO type)